MSKCIKWTGTIGADGYGRKWNAIRKNWDQAHRTIYAEYNGDIPKGLVVRHLCHNKKCVNIKHLTIGTPADNSQDMVDAERQARGEQIATSKLTEQQILDIRSSSLSGIKLAEIYGVHKTTIYRILKRENWKHI